MIQLAEPQVEVLRTNIYRTFGDDFVYEWTEEGMRQRIIVHPGFVFDGASIPWAAQVWVGKWDLGKGPPCIHDLLYQHGGDLSHSTLGQHWFYDEFDGEWDLVNRVWTRREADRLFGRHMREAQVPKWKRRMAFRAVQLFRSKAWQGKTLTRTKARV